MNRNTLLDMKRRLVAISLAGTCALGLAGCGDEYSYSSENEEPKLPIESETKERTEQLLAIYEDRAIIIEPQTIAKNSFESFYGVYFAPREVGYDLCVPMSEFTLFDSRSPITAEEYVALACGPDFPIEYIRSEDYKQTR